VKNEELYFYFLLTFTATVYSDTIHYIDASSLRHTPIISTLLRFWQKP